MNEYTYEQIELGQEAHFERIITAEMMEQFKELSGDINPLHCSEDYAKAQGYPARVVYGMLTASLYSTLAGVYLPGKHCLLHGIDSKFRRPVFIGDTLRVSGKVVEKNDTVHMIVVKAEVINDKGEKVSKAMLKVGVSEDGNTGEHS